MEKTKTIPPAVRGRMRRALEKEATRLLKQADLLAQVDHEVWAAGRDLFVTDSALAVWLASPARALHNATPLMVLRGKSGRVRVLNLIGAVMNGGYM